MAANNVQLLREAAMLTPDELGEVIGDSAAAIERYEAGAAIPLEVAEKMAKMFAVSVSFVRGED